MTTYNDADRRAAARLEELLNRPLPEADNLGEIGYFAPWDAFDGIVGAYDSMIDCYAIKTLEAIRDHKTFELLDGEHCLFVEFFLHVLAGHHYVEYGTSPRGAFATPGGVDSLLPHWISKWRRWYLVNWQEDPR